MLKKPSNLKRTDETLSGTEIAALNNLEPGLGLKLHRLFSSLGSSVAAQAGHKGPVAIQPMTEKDSTGQVIPAMNLLGGRVGNADDAINDDEYVTLRQARRLLQVPDAETPSADFTRQQVCQEVSLVNQLKSISGLTAIYTVAALNEFIYVAGANASPAFQVFRHDFDQNTMTLVGSLTQSEAFQRMDVQGRFIFGGATSSASHRLTVIDCVKPDAPYELTVLDVGKRIWDVKARGRFIYCACTDSVRIVDASVIGALRVFGSAS